MPDDHNDAKIGREMTNKTTAMKVASVADAKSHLSALLADVAAGREVVITRRGKPVARMVPEPAPTAAFDWSSLHAWLAEPARPGLTVAEMRETDLL